MFTFIQCVRKRIKYGHFRLVAGTWSDNGWAGRYFFVVNIGFASTHNAPISDFESSVISTFVVPYCGLKVLGSTKLDLTA